MGAQKNYGRERMKRIALAAGLAILAPFAASAQTTEQLVKGATDTSNVLNYGMGYNLQRFSPLTQINKDNARNLVPVWNYSLADDRAEESQPIVYQGVIYVTTHAATMAVDVKTGRQIWKTKVDSHAFAGITGAPVVSGGKMFVPIQGISGMNLPFIFAVATVATIPTIVLFLFFQRYFVQGVQGFGIKG